MDVTAIGGINVDIISRPNTHLTPGESAPGRCQFQAGGVAANIARHLSDLGHHVILLSAVGSGALSKMVLDSLGAHRIDCSHVVRSEAHEAAIYSVIVDEHGATQFGVSDMQVLEVIDPNYVLSHSSLIQKSPMVVADTNLSTETLQAIAGCAHMLFVDAVSPQKAPRLSTIVSNIHTIKVNLAEAQVLTGKQMPSECAAELYMQGIRQVFVSAGQQGLYWHSDEGAGHQSTSAIAPLYDTGCGDAIMAGLIDAQLQHMSCNQAARQALALLDRLSRLRQTKNG